MEGFHGIYQAMLEYWKEQDVVEIGCGEVPLTATDCTFKSYVGVDPFLLEHLKYKTNLPYKAVFCKKDALSYLRTLPDGSKCIYMAGVLECIGNDDTQQQM